MKFEPPQSNLVFAAFFLCLATICSCSRPAAVDDSSSSNGANVSQSASTAMPETPARSETSPHTAQPALATTEPAQPVVRLSFVESAVDAGLTFVHRSGAAGDFTYPEIMAGGVCLADLDSDGDLDVYIPQSGPIPGEGGEPGRNVLYLNDGTGKFTDASAASNADDPAYGMGAFAADIDADGDYDLLLTNAGSLTLLQNEGQAKFKDVTEAAGLSDRDGFWLNAVITDLNADNVPDIYIANYTNWKSGIDPDCKSPGGLPDYCNPTAYPGAPDLLFFGNGDGKFTDASTSSGINAVSTRSMGIVAFDADADGDLDLYVANDGEANLLWINQGDGTFQDEAMIRGAALNNAGVAEASMGVGCGDVDADGDEDIILTHLSRETHTLYRNDDGYFSDATAAAGLASWSRPDTGFGIALIDFNLDSQLDLFVANGGVARPTSPTFPDRPYAQADRFSVGTAGGRFPSAEALAKEESEVNAGDGRKGAAVSRGLAAGDLTGDGYPDVIVAIKDGSLRFFRNTTKANHHWLAIRPVERAGGACVVNATATIQTSRLQTLSVRPHASYLGSHEDVIRFGMGTQDQPADVLVKWPDGSKEWFNQLAVDKTHEAVRGCGSANQSNPSASVQPMAATGDAANASSLANESVSNAPVASNVAAADLGPIPPIKFERLDARSESVILDREALAKWCRKAGLPQPPETDSIDPATWKLVYPAIEAAAATPNAKSLSDLAMYYNGQNMVASSIELYKLAAKMAPGDIRWWHLLGRACYDEGQTQLAVEALSNATKLDPKNSASIGHLAEAQLANGQAAEAKANWTKYVKQLPQDPIGHTGLARAAETLGELEVAAKSVQAALAINPKARPALVAGARVAARQGDSKLAKEYSRRATALTKADDPILSDNIDLAMRAHAKSVGYLRKAANFYKSKGHYAEAMTAAKLLAERRPKEAQNWQMLTWLSTVMKKPRDAVKYAEIAVAVDPKFAPGWDTIANARIAEKDYQAALNAANKALQVNPRFALAYLSRGIALAKLQKYEQALPALENGLRARPTDINGLAMKAKCLIQLGQKPAAKLTLNRLLKVAPNHAWGRKALAELR